MLSFLAKIVYDKKQYVHFLWYYKWTKYTWRIIYIRNVLKARRVRKHKLIKFMFVLSDLSVWKTEELYKAMRKHSRFIPIIAIVPNSENVNAHLQVERYCKLNGYDYIKPLLGKTLVQQFNPDIILYQKPYDGWIAEEYYITRNMKSLIVHIPYGLHTHKELWGMNQMHYIYSWQYYYENELCAQPQREMSLNRGKNVVVTGLPMLDELMLPIKDFSDPWHDKSGKIRFIWAPHHTIAGIANEGVAYATFLQYYDFMIELAEKYKNDITIAFKPHNVLYHNLVKIWGETRTNDYYNKWNSMPNTQLVTGKYVDLFKYSDAMIHDCGAFKIEYLYTCKPVMYLTNSIEEQTHNLNDFAKKAFNLHYVGMQKLDIENFIINIINGNDPKAEDRRIFYRRELCPPNNTSACDNIINSILGIKGYK